MEEAERTRLTYLITGLQYGGANIGMVRLLSKLSQDEFDITVVSLVETPHDVVDQLPDHVRVVPLEISSPLEIYRISRLIPLLRQTDILVCSLFHATAVGIPIATLMRVPTKLVWQHSTHYPSSTREYGYRLFYCFVDYLLADSHAVSESITDNQGVSKSKIQKLPIAGINTNVFSPRFDGSDSEKILVATVGRLVEAKGYSELVEVAKMVDGEYEFNIVGTGPERERFESKAPDNVQFKGRVENKEIPSVLSSCDLYFQPSHYEGLCMTVIEAMACELPVVASAVGGITESVVPEETGFLCQPKDVECFSERIRQLGNDPELRTRMGRRGRERVKENYSAEALADAFRDTLAAAEKQ